MGSLTELDRPLMHAPFEATSWSCRLDVNLRTGVDWTGLETIVIALSIVTSLKHTKLEPLQ